MAAQITVIPRTEQLRDWDCKAVADANDKAEDQIVASALTPQNRPTMMVSASA